MAPSGRVLDLMVHLAHRDHFAAELAGEGDAEGFGDGGFEQVVEIGFAHFSHVLWLASLARHLTEETDRSPPGLRKLNVRGGRNFLSPTQFATILIRGHIRAGSPGGESEI